MSKRSSKSPAVRCPRCNASGKLSLPMLGVVPCPTCKGSGRLDATRLAWLVDRQRVRARVAAEELEALEALLGRLNPTFCNG